MMNKIRPLITLLGIMILFQNTVFAEGEWKREIALGYNKSSGNTDKSELSITGAIKREMEYANFGSSADIYYSESNGQMDSQKWTSLTRYAFDFSSEYKWFNSYQMEVTHDRFADIDYRLLPSVGIGYWFSREEDWTWSVEGSAGYEMTKYRSNKEDDNSPVLLGHTYLKKKILENAFISEDFSIIPTLDNTGTRIKSETEFTNPLSKGLDLSIKYIIDHDTEPSAGKEKTDTRFITSLKYSF
ncbi:MAG: DUF481 domain-containing protein [Candidatus Omnitrophica bacterium]|nr:DUF481 domain-containing protein [Candidatus Omnitrophota bacterium]